MLSRIFAYPTLNLQQVQEFIRWDCGRFCIFWHQRSWRVWSISVNTLGMSFVRADFEVGGINVPHFHPTATEIAFVLKGTVYSGFVDTNNQVFAKVIEKGEVMVFPSGLVHFQMNVGATPATILGSFNSQNPGLQRIPSAVFGSGIKDKLLEKAFGLSSKEISKLRKRLAPH